MQYGCHQQEILSPNRGCWLETRPDFQMWRRNQRLSDKLPDGDSCYAVLNFGGDSVGHLAEGFADAMACLRFDFAPVQTPRAQIAQNGACHTCLSSNPA